MCGRARLSSDVSEIKVAFRIPPERRYLSTAIPPLTLPLPETKRQRPCRLKDFTKQMGYKVQAARHESAGEE